MSVGLPHTTVELLSVYPSYSTGDGSLPSSKRPHTVSKAPKPPFSIDVGHSAIFRVNVSHPKSLGTFTGEIIIHTSLEKVLHVPVYYKTTVGGFRIEPEVIEFEPVFPFNKVEVPLRMSSYYHHPVSVTSIHPESMDPRFHVDGVDGESQYPWLKPSEPTQVSCMVKISNLVGNGSSMLQTCSR